MAKGESSKSCGPDLCPYPFVIFIIAIFILVVSVAMIVIIVLALRAINRHGDDAACYRQGCRTPPCGLSSRNT